MFFLLLLPIIRFISSAQSHICVGEHLAHFFPKGQRQKSPFFCLDLNGRSAEWVTSPRHRLSRACTHYMETCFLHWPGVVMSKAFLTDWQTASYHFWNRVEGRPVFYFLFFGFSTQHGFSDHLIKFADLILTDSSNITTTDWSPLVCGSVGQLQ